MHSRWALGLIVCSLAAIKFCHSGVLWAEETLPMAAAQQMLHGKTLYREVWFDKPPLVAATYLLWSAKPGGLVRLAGALYTILAATMAYLLARRLWSEREGWVAAALLAFFLTFDTHSAVLPLAADLFLLAPHLTAIYFAVSNRAFLAGALCGVGFLFNAKALFVLLACIAFAPGFTLRTAAGFAVVCSAGGAALYFLNAWPDYIEQVWWWSGLYSANTFLAEPILNGVRRTANWLGFHAALIPGCLLYFRSKDTAGRRVAIWIILSAVALAAGLRFFPRYYFQLLAPLTIIAARGFLLHRGAAIAACVLLLIPLARFGPRHLELGVELAQGRAHDWRDVAMDRDSRAAAQIVRAQSQPGDTLFVWGYRPELYVYTGMPAESRFLESQPLTGVFADRHLFQSNPVASEFARENRRALSETRPAFIVDGLTKYNPELSLGRYPELRAWLAGYRRVGSTDSSVIYRRAPERAAKLNRGAMRTPGSR